MDIGIALRRARGRAGLSQRALAELTGVAQPTIARIERGREEPRIGTLRVVLSACGHRLDITRSGGEGIDRTAIPELLAVVIPKALSSEGIGPFGGELSPAISIRAHRILSRPGENISQVVE